MSITTPNICANLMRDAMESAKRAAEDKGGLSHWEQGFYTGAIMAYGFAADDIDTFRQRMQLIEQVEALPIKGVKA